MKKIAVIGIGYVGLPLARLFSTKYPVIGYDISLEGINELNNCKDSLNELSKNILKKKIIKKNKNLNFNNIYKINKYDAIVLAVNHINFKKFNYKENLKKNSVLYDVKRVLKNKNIDGGL